MEVKTKDVKLVGVLSVVPLAGAAVSTETSGRHREKAPSAAKQTELGRPSITGFASNSTPPDGRPG